MSQFHESSLQTFPCIICASYVLLMTSSVPPTSLGLHVRLKSVFAV